MNITLKSMQTEDSDITELLFLDTDTQESLGKITYSIIKKDAHINYTYLKPEYRRMGILKKSLNSILCDMKCKGATNAYLHTITEEAREAWSKLGFKEISENEIKEAEKRWTKYDYTTTDVLSELGESLKRTAMKKELEEICLCCDK